MSGTWLEARDVAARTARAAGMLLRERLSSSRQIDYKDAGWSNLVTDADRDSEQLILEALKAAFPQDALLAEESGAQGTHRRTWVVDPLDGTVNYAHGVPHFCVSIALAVDAQPVAGVVYDPMRDELFSAATGSGATLNGRAIQVSNAQQLDRSLVCTGFPYDLAAFPAVDLFRHIVPRVQGIRRMGAAALELAWLAAGRFDGFFEFALKPWDTAAGALLVREAGGTVVPLLGGSWTTNDPHVIAGPTPIVVALAQECAQFAQRPRS